MSLEEFEERTKSTALTNLYLSSQVSSPRMFYNYAELKELLEEDK